MPSRHQQWEALDSRAGPHGFGVGWAELGQGPGDGKVPLEDLVEEIVGEIRDEYASRTRGDEPGVVHGAVSLEDFNDHTGLELPDGDDDTVAGYLVARVGRIPDVGDSVAVGDTLLEVVARTGMRVTAIRVGPAPAEDTSAEEDHARGVLSEDGVLQAPSQRDPHE